MRREQKIPGHWRIVLGKLSGKLNVALDIPRKNLSPYVARTFSGQNFGKKNNISRLKEQNTLLEDGFALTYKNIRVVRRRENEIRCLLCFLLQFPKLIVDMSNTEKCRADIVISSGCLRDAKKET